VQPWRLPIARKTGQKHPDFVSESQTPFLRTTLPPAPFIGKTFFASPIPQTGGQFPFQIGFLFPLTVFMAVSVPIAKEPSNGTQRKKRRAVHHKTARRSLFPILENIVHRFIQGFLHTLLDNLENFSL
jgi:hypothetical protein